jgi:hypothetical protein
VDDARGKTQSFHFGVATPESDGELRHLDAVDLESPRELSRVATHTGGSIE